MRFEKVGRSIGLYSVYVAFMLGCVAGCGDSPAAPTPPGPTSITVTGEDLLLVGKSQAFGATGNTGAPVAVRWGSDAPAVATVSAGGIVTAVGTGTATIFADANGIRGTRSVRTLPDFGGEWSVQYRVVRCEATGDYLVACPRSSDVDSLDLDLVQMRESVTGGFWMTDWLSYLLISDDVSGAVAADGVLSFVASGREVGPGSTLFPPTMQLQKVRLALDVNTRLTGTFEQVLATGDLRAAGSVRYFCELLPSVRYRR